MKLDDDDIKMLRMFQNIPASSRTEEWHRECHTLQMKLQGVAELDTITDQDWDQAMDYIKRHNDDLIKAHKDLKKKYG